MAGEAFKGGGGWGGGRWTYNRLFLQVNRPTVGATYKRGEGLGGVL